MLADPLLDVRPLPYATAGAERTRLGEVRAFRDAVGLVPVDAEQLGDLGRADHVRSAHR